jgi:hypothetical protein
MSDKEARNDVNNWDRFLESGRIEDYLMYTGDMQQPEIGTAQLVAMNNAAALSGIGGMNTFGTNNLAAIARQDLINADAAVNIQEEKTRKRSESAE